MRRTKGRSRAMRFYRVALVVTVLATSILTLAGPAQAERIFGSKGPDRIVGTAKADVIKAPGGNDRVKGGRGRGRHCGAPGGGAPGAGLGCATPPEEARLAAGGLARAAGDPTPTFSDPFYATTITLDVSVDELDGDQLPISIEGVCDVPNTLLGEAGQLVGGDGIAIVSPTTQVFDATG